MSDPLLEVKIAEKKQVADAIVQLKLVSVTGENLPAFSAGSHIDLHLGADLIRQYSLSNNPKDTIHYQLGVLKEVDGRGGSTAVHALDEGATIQISQPRNNFKLDETADHSLLIAGGIGITPILSMAQHLQNTGQSYELHYCARDEERMAFRDFLQQEEFAGKVHFHFDNGPDDQKFDIAALSDQSKDGTHLYVCGPTGFMDAVLAACENHWPGKNVHREYFTSEPVAADGEERVFQIQIGEGGDILEVSPDRSIVEVLADAGIDIPVSCEQGICGTCLTPVLQGTPDHRDLVLTEEEHADNDQMTLCCSRALSDLLVLDL